MRCAGRHSSFSALVCNASGRSRKGNLIRDATHGVGFARRTCSTVKLPGGGLSGVRRHWALVRSMERRPPE